MFYELVYKRSKLGTMITNSSCVSVFSAVNRGAIT